MSVPLLCLQLSAPVTPVVSSPLPALRLHIQSFLDREIWRMLSTTDVVRGFPILRKTEPSALDRDDQPASVLHPSGFSPPLPPPFDRSVVRGSQRNRPPPPPGWGQDGGTDSHQDACSETELIFSVQEYIADVSQLSKFDKEGEVLLVPWLRFTVLQVPSSHVILDAIFFFVALETQTPPKGWGGGGNAFGHFVDCPPAWQPTAVGH